MAKRALIVGINDYSSSPLNGCIPDAKKIESLMHRNEDGTPNFDCKLLISSEVKVDRKTLRENIEALFKDPADMAFFYFSGHGCINSLGGYLVTQDAQKYDEGVSMSDILAHANNSNIKECVIMLDCCFSGCFGTVTGLDDSKLFIREGISILTASRENQVSWEGASGGFFTSLVCDALSGSASDLLGNITTASIYAHVEPIFGAWDQRPLFKTHVSKSTAIRKCKPLIDPHLLRELPNIFARPDEHLKLDKSFEPTEKPRNPENEATFGKLQKFRAQGLVHLGNGEDHLYYAALNNGYCYLSASGQFYWHLAKNSKI